ncbi:MAG: MoxR family ATPase [Armatimonadetes bacterium]|nr:MoxR family ATPase [Armatimonadota bacterium]MBS1727831.1 MoxR family ATPase [Armatimonadota bacterium]
MLRRDMSVEQLSQRIHSELAKVISGQEQVIEQIIAATLADGHVLLEGVPGLAKTLMVRSLGHVLGMKYGRVQFTPDMMPSDVSGTMVFDMGKNEFQFRPGPIFVGLLLADEINRTPPKTQSALLEAMEERKVTIDGVAHDLPAPFLVFATQNPLEYEGTYPLPEAQQDRFLMKVMLRYPSAEQEVQVLRLHHSGFQPKNLDEQGLQTVTSVSELQSLQAQVRKTTVEDKVFNYIYEIVKTTRDNRDIMVGASPRAGIGLLNVSKAVAQIRGRDFVIPDDVKEMAPSVLRHRIQLRPESEIEGQTPDDVLKRILDSIAVPR